MAIYLKTCDRITIVTTYFCKKNIIKQAMLLN